MTFTASNFIVIYLCEHRALCIKLCVLKIIYKNWFTIVKVIKLPDISLTLRMLFYRYQ